MFSNTTWSSRELSKGTGKLSECQCSEQGKGEQANKDPEIIIKKLPLQDNYYYYTYLPKFYVTALQKESEQSTLKYSYYTYVKIH